MSRWLMKGSKYLPPCVTRAAGAAAKNSRRQGPATALCQIFSINYLYNL